MEKVDERPGDLYLVCVGARGYKYEPFGCALRGVFYTYAKAKVCFIRHSPRGCIEHCKHEIPDAVTKVVAKGATVRELLYSHDLDDCYGGSDCVYLLQIRPAATRVLL